MDDGWTLTGRLRWLKTRRTWMKPAGAPDSEAIPLPVQPPVLQQEWTAPWDGNFGIRLVPRRTEWRDVPVVGDEESQG